MTPNFTVNPSQWLRTILGNASRTALGLLGPTLRGTVTALAALALLAGRFDVVIVTRAAAVLGLPDPLSTPLWVIDLGIALLTVLSLHRIRDVLLADVRRVAAEAREQLQIVDLIPQSIVLGDPYSRATAALPTAAQKALTLQICRNVVPGVRWCMVLLSAAFAIVIAFRAGEIIWLGFSLGRLDHAVIGPYVATLVASTLIFPWLARGAASPCELHKVMSDPAFSLHGLEQRIADAAARFVDHPVGLGVLQLELLKRIAHVAGANGAAGQNLRGGLADLIALLRSVSGAPDKINGVPLQGRGAIGNSPQG